MFRHFHLQGFLILRISQKLENSFQFRMELPEIIILMIIENIHLIIRYKRQDTFFIPLYVQQFIESPCPVPGFSPPKINDNRYDGNIFIPFPHAGYKLIRCQPFLPHLQFLLPFLPLSVISHAFRQHGPKYHMVIHPCLIFHCQHRNGRALPQPDLVPDHLFYVAPQNTSQLPVLFSQLLRFHHLFSLIQNAVYQIRKNFRIFQIITLANISFSHAFFLPYSVFSYKGVF